MPRRTTAKNLTEWEWVALAAQTGRDATPILAGVNVSPYTIPGKPAVTDGRRLAATDRHRLHIVADTQRGLNVGNWAPLTRDPIDDGTFPAFDQVVPAGEPTHIITERDSILALCAGAIAAGKVTDPMRYLVTLRAVDGTTAAYQPAYLRDALRCMTATTVELLCTTWSHPIRLACGRLTAVVMPVRRPEGFDVSDYFDLSRFTEEVEPQHIERAS